MQDAEIQTAPATGIPLSDVKRAEVIEYVRKINSTLQEMMDKTDKVSADLTGDEVVRSGLNYITTIKEAVSLFLRFLESPLGKTTTDILWKYIDGLKDLAQVGAGIVISVLFVVVAQEMMIDVKEDEFDSARRKIGDCIRFVQSKLPEIEVRVNEAADLLRQVRNHQGADTQGLERTLWNFKETIRLAKLDIDDCQEHLERTDKNIQSAMAKIKAKIWLNGLFRGALFGGGALTVYFSLRSKIPFRTGYFIGFILMGSILLVRVPRYRKLKRDFTEYRDTHDNLHTELRRLQRRLESHERAAL